MKLYSVTGNIWVISKDEFLWDWNETEEAISIDLFYINVSGEGNGSPLQYSCLENPMDRGAWWAAVRGVARVGQDLVTKPPCCPEPTEDNPSFS